MFTKQSDSGYVAMMEGIERKTLVHGEKTLLAEFHLEKGKTLPRHSHPNEQTGYLIKGRLQFTIGTETFDTQAGDSWCIPADLEHHVEVLEDSLVIEVFSPVREDFLP